MKDILIKNGLTVDAGKTVKQDLLISDGKIALCGYNLACENAEIIDAEGCYVMPGLIDSHTHYHLVSRGTVTADSFIQGSRLASFGGVTTVIDFADHNKGMGLVQSMEYRLNEMKAEMAVDYSLHQGVYGHGFDSTIPKQLEDLKEKGIKTLKIFTTYRETGYLLEDKDKILTLFKNAKRLGMLVCAHCEYNPLIEEISSKNRDRFKPEDHADLRPAEAEARAIEYYGSLAFEADCPFYVVHVSSEAGLNEIRKLRGRGATIFAETTPTYLFLDRKYLEGSNGALYVMTPPLRTEKDCKALKEAVENGEIDVIATDHCSFTREQKLSSDDVRTIYPGIPGTEEMFHLLYTYTSCNIEKLVDMMSTTPARIFGLYPEKGSLKVGTDADITVFDPRVKWTITNENVHSASLYSPYCGFEINGKVKTVLLRGKIIMDGEKCFTVPGEGRFLAQEGFYDYHNYL